ncbi:hypothetical protein JOE40_001136 [Arthrobacter sp. PvP102]|uniref:hypothetical protein n=1 Tax=unclassified Arthrobacter TaxID=235627 RepID=UPI001B417BE9|nr:MULTISPECIES: hypothetical protein [unclassified Arthrobacter]MBP1231492.1 hypothetical protein [Arthrobacter sp. PvP103]MBP1236627.1 hypothetical protein [Arthrobacter sp. PvP102]
MNGFPRAGRRRSSATFAVLGALVAGPAMQGCSPQPQAPGPLTAELNQFRDSYGTGIIEIQLSNTANEPVTVLSAEVSTSLFPAGTAWHAQAEGTEVPPGQTKSLPARLPAPACGHPGTDEPETAEGAETGPGSAPAEVTVSVRQGSTTREERLTAADPFGVLARNYSELCLAQDAGEIADIGLAPDLEVAADGRTAVVRLRVTPRSAGAGASRTLTIERIEGTTLLAEAQGNPWPRSITVATGAAPRELRLHIRPARCDPHAVAEDKVGTLLPLRADAGGRQGVLKVAAGTVLKARIYEFVTAACAAH